MPSEILPMLTLALTESERAALDLLLVIATAGLVVMLFARLRLATVPGYLIAGALIGPHALGLVTSGQRITELGQLSTILLMFIIGLQLDLTRVRLGLVAIIWSAIAATVIGVFVAFPIAWAMTGNAPASLAIAMAMSVAATAVPLRTLERRRELHTTYGRLAFGITLFQDLLAVGMLALLPLLVLWAGVSDSNPLEEGGLLRTVGRGAIAVGGIIALVLLGRIVFPRLLAAAGHGGGEVLIVVSAAVALGAAVLSRFLGFSPELGAFLAGFLLAGTPFRHQIAGQLIPMRDLFLAVLFTVVGMTIPILAVAEGWWVVLLGVVALGVVKIVGVALGSWLFGATPRFGLLAAVTLAPAGEFTLVMLAQSRAAGVLTDEHVGYATAVVGISIIAAPIIVRLGHAVRVVDRLPMAPWSKAAALRPLGEHHPGEQGVTTTSPADGVHPPAAPTDAEPARPAWSVIIAGFGPVGRAVADRLERQGASITIIELNPKTIARQATLGRRVVYGDASSRAVLESAGIESARAIILTAPDEEAMLRACEVVRSLRKDVFISMRANALSSGLRAKTLGADHITVEELVTADAMSRAVEAELMRFEDNARLRAAEGNQPAPMGAGTPAPTPPGPTP